MDTMKKKLILAILQGDDYADTVDELNQNGFFVTILSSTGGFLKKKSVTVMIGVEEEKVQRVLEILKQSAVSSLPTLTCPCPPVCMHRRSRWCLCR